MKQTLQLKLSQHLTLTPQLQQSIRLLQLSTLELNAEVERILQENPLLEKEEAEGEEDQPQEFALATRDRAPEIEAEHRASVAEEEVDDRPLDVTQAADPSDVADYGGDSDWGGGAPPEDDDFYPQQVATNTLRDHLREQLALLNLPLRDRQIVAALIDALDDDGYLTSSLDELGEIFPAELGIEPEELTIALKYLQSFEPAGVGARDCAECLALQLKSLPDTTAWRAEALKVVDGNLPLLANRDFTKLKRLLHCDDAGVRGIRELIRSLTPRPGSSFAKTEEN